MVNPTNLTSLVLRRFNLSRFFIYNINHNIINLTFSFAGWFFKPATITTKKGNPYMAVLISWFLVQVSVNLTDKNNTKEKYKTKKICQNIFIPQLYFT